MSYISSMKKILFIGLLCTACTKHEIKPSEPAENSLVYIGFRNFTSMDFNYWDGCEANIVPTGTTKFLRSGTDTICSFKIDAAGIISWKAYQGHVVTLGGCNIPSLTIHQ